MPKFKNLLQSTQSFYPNLLAYDNICKYLAEAYPAAFARWLLATEPENIQVLKTELTLEPVRADSITLLQTTQQILHLASGKRSPTSQSEA